MLSRNWVKFEIEIEIEILEFIVFAGCKNGFMNEYFGTEVEWMEVGTENATSEVWHITQIMWWQG